MNIKELLEEEAKKRDSFFELTDTKPDPLMVAKRYNSDKIALICALFAYGNAKQIVKFLNSLDFSLLEKDDSKILNIKNYYRFQNPLDVANIFLTLKRVGDLEEIFLSGYKKEESVLDGMNALIEEFERVNDYKSYGYSFLIGKKSSKKLKGESPYKRWNMFFRWMVRKDSLDLGLWKGVKKSSLIIPLDTHTFKVSQKLGLLNRKSYDLYSAYLLTQKLKEFDKDDPVRYDFALYRLGQEKIV